MRTDRTTPRDRSSVAYRISINIACIGRLNSQTVSLVAQKHVVLHLTYNSQILVQLPCFYKDCRHIYKGNKRSWQHFPYFHRMSQSSKLLFETPSKFCQRKPNFFRRYSIPISFGVRVIWAYFLLVVFSSSFLTMPLHNHGLILRLQRNLIIPYS